MTDTRPSDACRPDPVAALIEAAEHVIAKYAPEHLDDGCLELRTLQARVADAHAAGPFIAEGALSEILLHSLHIEGDSAEAALRPHPLIVRFLYDGLAQVLGDAQNYAETRVMPRNRPGRELIVTIQRRDGKTPHQLRVEAEAEAARLRSLLGERAP